MISKIVELASTARRLIVIVVVILTMFGMALVAAAEPDDEQTVLFRVNAGGGLVAALDEGPDWSADTLNNPSTYLAAGGDFINAFEVQSLESNVPVSTPTAIFETERWDVFGGPQMLWQFPVAEGTPVEVRLYLMNGFAGTSETGDRVFDVEIDGELAFSGIDLVAEAGHQVGTVRTYETTADGMIDIRFLHVVDNPLINGIEIVQTGFQPDVLSALPNSLDFGKLMTGSERTMTVMLANEGGEDDPVITIDNFTISDPAFTTSLTTGIPIAPDEKLETKVTFAPDSIGPVSATVDIFHSGINSPLTINLAGEGVDVPPIAFSSQTINRRQLPTQLEFGPDGRLYVAQLKGLIYAFTIERHDLTGNYSIAATEVIDLVQTIPNHNDDGTTYASNERNVTGMITAGTATNPVLYVTSSDPRIGAPDDSEDPLPDTNSGILSRLTWTGNEWTKLDLVRSLPRSAHDHFPNGLALDADNDILYLAQGGNTNMGAPSSNLGFVPEYALSAAILSIDLNAIGEQTYDIPTLKGEVFGGQMGNNQARIVPDGPVQVHSPGFRNANDVLLTSAGRLYTFDKPSSIDWGGPPIDEGPCTNEPNESDSATHLANFHLVTGPGYYGGHPNPTRANVSNTFDGLSPVPESQENPVECQFLIPGAEDGAIAVHDEPTNGLAEYTATNFSGQMAGNIIVPARDGKVLRLSLNSDGDQVMEENDLFTGLSGPLGVTAQGDADPFPGTIWIGQFFSGDITVFEPEDFVDSDRLFRDRFEIAEE